MLQASDLPTEVQGEEKAAEIRHGYLRKFFLEDTSKQPLEANLYKNHNQFLYEPFSVRETMYDPIVEKYSYYK